MHRFLLPLLLLFRIVSHSQINPSRLDSLSHAIDSSQRAHRQWQDSFQKSQDSMYQSVIRNRDIEQSTKNLERLMLEMKERDRKKKQEAYIRIGIGIVLLIVLVIGLSRRRRKQHNS